MATYKPPYGTQGQESLRLQRGTGSCQNSPFALSALPCGLLHCSLCILTTTACYPHWAGGCHLQSSPIHGSQNCHKQILTGRMAGLMPTPWKRESVHSSPIPESIPVLNGYIQPGKVLLQSEMELGAEQMVSRKRSGGRALRHLPCARFWNLKLGTPKSFWAKPAIL